MVWMQRPDEFPVAQFGKMKLGRECFAGVSLESASYAKLLDHIAALNVSPKVEFDGGLSQVRSLMGTLAREKLIKKLGWTIYDGDHPKSVPGN